MGDLLAGAPLQLASLAGYSPIVAGRFVGFGNLAFAIFGTAMLLTTAALVSDRSPRFTSWVVLGIVISNALVWTVVLALPHAAPTILFSRL